MIGFVIAFFIGSGLVAVVYHLYLAVRTTPLQEWEKPAGRIHLFEGDRYFDSSPDNPFENQLLNWADGLISCLLSSDLIDRPEYQPAMIGTIQVLKPEQDKGIVSVIFSTDRIEALGLQPIGLVSGAQMLVDNAVPEATLRSNHA